VVTFSTIFQLYFGSQFYWRKPELPEKTTDLPQVTDKLDHLLYRVHLATSRIQTHNVWPEKKQKFPASRWKKWKQRLGLKFFCLASPSTTSLISNCGSL